MKIDDEYKTPTILAIDDILVNLILMESHLEDHQVNLITKTSALEVINEIDALHPDIILMDLIMPDLDGIEAARLIKQNNKTRHIPIIAISASQEEIEKIAKDQSFSAALKKPFTKEDLLKVLTRFIPIYIAWKDGKTLQDRETNLPNRKLLKTQTHLAEKDLSGIQFRRPTILAIDDLEVNLLLLESYIDGHNIKLITRTSVLEAMNDLPKLQPDLILMDIMMPELNGREAAKKIKEDNKTHHIPIISFTVNEKELELTTNDNTFAGTLGKPFTKTELFELLYQFMPYTETGVAE